MTKCTICSNPITLVPSATERARKYGGKPSDYTRLFTEHADCVIAKRNVDTLTLVSHLKNVRSSLPSYLKQQENKHDY